MPSTLVFANKGEREWGREDRPRRCHLLLPTLWLVVAVPAQTKLRLVLYLVELILPLSRKHSLSQKRMIRISQLGKRWGSWIRERRLFSEVKQKVVHMRRYLWSKQGVHEGIVFASLNQSVHGCDFILWNCELHKCLIWLQSNKDTPRKWSSHTSFYVGVTYFATKSFFEEYLLHKNGVWLIVIFWCFSNC